MTEFVDPEEQREILVFKHEPKPPYEIIEIVRNPAWMISYYMGLSPEGECRYGPLTDLEFLSCRTNRDRFLRLETKDTNWHCNNCH